MCGVGGAATRRGVARRETNSAWLGRLGRAPRAAISGRFQRRLRRAGFSSYLPSPGRATRAAGTYLRSSRCAAAATQKRCCHQRAVGGLGGARPRQSRGEENAAGKNKVRVEDGGEATSASAVPDVVLLRARRAPLVVAPGVWGMVGNRELTIAKESTAIAAALAERRYRPPRKGRVQILSMTT